VHVAPAGRHLNAQKRVIHPKQGQLHAVQRGAPTGIERDCDAQQVRCGRRVPQRKGFLAAIDDVHHGGLVGLHPHWLADNERRYRGIQIRESVARG
jgi:hypothetical protein